MSERKSVDSVFTPRNPDINLSMYVKRPDLEKELSRSIQKNIHTLICGESGNGKSWLYKKVLKDLRVPYLVVNCANASRQKSITKEIYNVIISPGTGIPDTYNDLMNASIGIPSIAKGGLQYSKTVKIKQEDELHLAYKEFATRHIRGIKKILVLENLEIIFKSEELMSELADIIILLDDMRFSKFNINLLIVGLPADVLEYFTRTRNLDSVANRIDEIEKVGCLTDDQVKQIIFQGFKQLKINISDNDFITLASYVDNITLGVAQRVHEYCECLGFVVEDNNWEYSSSLIQVADEVWIKKSLRKCYVVIESHLNTRSTKITRRNQVIYAIGKIERIKFNSIHVEEVLRQEFPKSIPSTHMGIGAILNDLAKSNAPLIKKNVESNDYSIYDPLYLMCIRVVLNKNNDKIIKKNFKIRY